MKLQKHIIKDRRSLNFIRGGAFQVPPDFPNRTTPRMYRKADAYDYTCFFADFSIKNFQLIGRATRGRSPIVIILYRPRKRRMHTHYNNIYAYTIPAHTLYVPFVVRLTIARYIVRVYVLFHITLQPEKPIRMLNASSAS